MAKITIIIKEGKVQAVDGLNDHMCLEVRNYDVDELDARRVSKDENGRLCEILEWHEAE